ncbi:hypothetical protein HMPREF1395_01532 [Helicobacter pylori GAM112Ai]|nr:hypothetical protein HMPREF1395_01532 [Helicobacter pylori GAM112Ai]
MRVWCHPRGVFKGVCCRISSRPISGFMGQITVRRVYHEKKA